MIMSLGRPPRQLVKLAAWLFALIALLAVGLPATVFAGPGAPGHAPGDHAAGGHQVGGEANIILPDLSTTQMMGTDGKTLLMGGLGVCALGLLFSFILFSQLNKMPVHRSMKEISELIYETCKTYLVTQGKFILLLELFIGAIMVVYYGVFVGFPA